MQHNRFRICPMQRYLCFRIILLQVQIRQANNVRHLFSPLLQSRASRASRVRGFSFYMARCSRLWRISVLSALLGQRPEPIRDSGFFFFLSLAARAEPRRPFGASFAGSARSRYALRPILRICGVRHTVCAGRNTEAPRPTEASKSATAGSAPYRR